MRSERQLVEQIQNKLLFRKLLGLTIHDKVCNRSEFIKKLERLIHFEAVTELFNAALQMAERRGLLSGEHSTKDGTLIQAWAGRTSMWR